MAGLEDLYPSFAEYARRSLRNLGMGAQAMADNATANNAAIRAGADATRKLMAGGDLSPAEEDAVHNSPIGGFGTDGGGPAPGGAIIGTYVGRNAATANLKRLGQAQRMIERGMDAEHTRKTTGWFRDPTGDWKYEISDHRAELRPDPQTGRYSLRHPELERAYPGIVSNLKIGELPGTDSFGRPNPTVAEYRRDSHTANLNLSAIKDPDEALKVLLHELQHGVQFKEGHSPGTQQASDEIGHLVNTEYWPAWEAADAAVTNLQKAREKWFHEQLAAGNKAATIEDYDRAFPEWGNQYVAALKARNTFPGINDWTFQKYQSALGEVEARDTMNRVKMTPDQRRQNPPYAGENIPWHDIWDIRKVAEQMRPPRKVADTPEPEDLRRLIQRRLGLLPPE